MSQDRDLRFSLPLMTGDDVRKVQLALVQAGSLDPGGADGIFGPATADAVRKFQIGRSLKDNGIVEANTRAALFGGALSAKPTPVTAPPDAAARPNLISAAVGAGNAANQPLDVMIIRRLLAIAFQEIPLSPNCDPPLIDAIKQFQVKSGAVRNPDGRIDPGGGTLRRLVAEAARRRPNRPDLGAFPGSGPVAALGDDGGNVQAWVDQILLVATRSILTEADFAAAAAKLGAGIPVALVRAFAEVESGGRSAFDFAGRPVIAYEGHVFRKMTGGRFDEEHALLSYPYPGKAGEQWKTNNANQDASWKTLEAAIQLDQDAALQACSWGMFQVMGFNYQDCGYPSATAFVEAIKSSAGAQLDAFVTFCKAKKGMVEAMARRDYAIMATLYNGADYGDYDERIKNAFDRLSTNPSPANPATSASTAPETSVPGGGTSGRRFVASNPEQFKGQEWDDGSGNFPGECVSFVKRAAGTPVTRDWRKGEAVKGATNLQRGTAIATFNQDGKYPTGNDPKHAAIYLSQNEVGLLVLDQWKGHPVDERTLEFDKDDPINGGNHMFVIVA